MGCLFFALLAAAPLSPEAAAIAFDEALAMADAAPDLRGAQAAASTRRDSVAHLSALTSNPQLLLQPGARVTGGKSGPEAQLTLTQSFNLGGLGRAKKAAAQEEADLAALQFLSLRAQKRVAVGLAWLDTWAAQAASAAVHEEETQAHELVVRLERGAASGGVTRVEVATARAFAAEAAALHLEWEGRRVEAGAQLSSLLGLGAISLAGGPLPAFAEPATAALTGVGQLPGRVLAKELLAEQRRADEAKALWAPALQLSVQGGHDSPDQWFANVGVGLTLPLFEHGQRERAAHHAAAQRLEGEASMAQRQAQLTHDLIAHELEHTAETLAVLQNQQLPAAEEAATLEAKRFALGETTLFELTLLKRAALTARIATALALARFAAARAQARELMENR